MEIESNTQFQISLVTFLFFHFVYLLDILLFRFLSILIKTFAAIFRHMDDLIDQLLEDIYDVQDVFDVNYVNQQQRAEVWYENDLY